MFYGYFKKIGKKKEKKEKKKGGKNILKKLKPM
jgi:hypothetical protein